MIFFLNFILLGKGMKIRLNIGRKTAEDERDAMNIEAIGMWKLFGGGKSNLVVGEDRLEAGMHRRCRKSMNGVELGDNSQMNFFEDIFHATGTDDLRGAFCDALELILLALLLELHC
jgi:hypothetical protein